MDGSVKTVVRIAPKGDEFGVGAGDSESLKAKARPSDSRELDAAFRRHYKELFGHAYKIVGSSEAAEDALQEAFTRTVREINKGRQIDNLAGWLHVCVHRASLGFLRKQRYRRHTDLNDEGVDMLQTGSTHEAYLEAHNAGTLMDAVASLSDRQRSAFMMRDVFGMSSEEAASEIGISVPTFRQLVFRARTNIKKAAEKDIFVITPVWPLIRRFFASLNRGTYRVWQRFNNLIADLGNLMAGIGQAAVVLSVLGIAVGVASAYEASEKYIGKGLQSAGIAKSADLSNGAISAPAGVSPEQVLPVPVDLGNRRGAGRSEELLLTDLEEYLADSGFTGPSGYSQFGVPNEERSGVVGRIRKWYQERDGSHNVEGLRERLGTARESLGERTSSRSGRLSDQRQDGSGQRTGEKIGGGSRGDADGTPGSGPSGGGGSSPSPTTPGSGPVPGGGDTQPGPGGNLGDKLGDNKPSPGSGSGGGSKGIGDGSRGR